MLALALSESASLV